MDASPLLSSSEVGNVGITALTKQFSPAKHTKLRSWCMLKESKMVLKDSTALSFEIEENQTWLAYCTHTNDPTLRGKQECPRVELRPVNFCPNQCYDYSFTSLGPRELEHRVH